MPFSFFAATLQFAVYVLAALTLFAAAWLYLDAWLESKKKTELAKACGFLFLCMSFIVQATMLEGVASGTIGGSGEILPVALIALRIVGYVLLAGILLIEPLPQHPAAGRPTRQLAGGALVTPVVGAALISGVQFAFPLLAALTGLLYLRRSTIGLEHHLRAAALPFFVLSVSELFSLHGLFQHTTNPDMFRIVAPFGPMWMMQLVFLGIAVFFFVRWIWRYLLDRLLSQLFMIFTTAVVVIFVVTAVSFTTILLKNIQDETLARLATDVNVLRLTITSKQAERVSDAQVLAQNNELRAAVVEKNYGALANLTRTFLISKRLSTLVVVDEHGQVLGRGENSEDIGGSFSHDPLVHVALRGQETASVVQHEGALVPALSIRAASPIHVDGRVVGATMVGVQIDNSFVEGVKEATGLEAAVYAGSTLSASTLVAPDGKSRWVGTTETNPHVVRQVLEEAEAFTGSISLFNTPYFGAYTALQNSAQVPVGMLFVGQGQLTVLQTAGRSVELTFLITAVLLILSILPAYFIARYIAYQVR